MTLTTESPIQTITLADGWAFDIFRSAARADEFGFMAYAPGWSETDPTADERWGFDSEADAQAAAEASVESMRTTEGEPAMTTQTSAPALTITTAPERRIKRGLVPSLVNPAWTAGRDEDRDGWYAEAQVDGMDLQLSRFDDEAGWTIDAAFGPRGMPLWANGYGARYLLTKTLRADLAQALDAAIAERWGFDSGTEEAVAAAEASVETPLGEAIDSGTEEADAAT